MQTILQKYDKIFIDTSTFLVNGENVFDCNSDYVKRILLKEDSKSIQQLFFIENLLPILEENKWKINVPFEVIEEVRSHEEKIPTRTSNALKILNLLKKMNCLEVYRGENYPFTDNIFITVLFRYMTKYNMCLVTQDRNLADDVDTIKEFRSIDTNKLIHAYMVGFDKSGIIKLYKYNKRKNNY
tara:strand:- start:5342 stop:5893 length:552 start_codon:yes stop_codon:yes gene_type:complete